MMPGSGRLWFLRVGEPGYLPYKNIVSIVNGNTKKKDLYNHIKGTSEHTRIR